jgi:hypothetical protein
MSRAVSSSSPSAATSTRVLAKLSTSGRRLVTPELGLGTIDRWPTDAYRNHVEPCDFTLDLEPLDAAIDQIVASTRRHDAAAIDPAAAEAIHRALPLSRRQAADPAPWRYLAVIHRPDLVRHRWELRTWTTMRDRFWKPGTRPDSNVFARLWWIAELSRCGDDYATTRMLLRSQSLANAVFVRRLSDHAACVQACASVLGEQPAFVVEIVLAKFNMLLSTVPLEGRGDEQIVDILQRLLDEVGSGRWDT